VDQELEIKITFLPHQSAWRDLIRKGCRYPALVGGIGSGKTYCVAEGLRFAWENPGSRGMIVSPSYKMMRRIIYPTLQEDLPITAVMVKTWNRSDGIITLHNGSTIFLASADNPESLRGPNLAWAFVDEGALIDDEAWKIIIGRVRQPGFDGWCGLATTPKGRNWVWKRWVDEPESDYGYVRAKTKDNTHLADSYLRSLENSYSGEFARQELEGEFIVLEGLIYTEFDREIHVISELPAADNGELIFVRMIAGVDFGYTNPAVILVVGRDGDGRSYIVDEFYERQHTITEITTEGADLATAWPIETFWCDPSEPGYIREMCDAGLPARGADNKVMEGINRVKARLKVKTDGRPSLYVHRSCVNTIAEFESYVWKKKGDEFTDQPEKQGDHSMDALRYEEMMADREPEVILL